ncbi:MAG: DUF2924 domain-containing protein [Robiginitomaculum sp.]|nr:DUF2924 domain-containing protein [Robiginitomaculum sp.]
MRRSEERLESELSRLHALDRESLLSQWMKVFNYPPLKGARNITLQRGLSYHYQERAYGKLKASTSKKLLRISSSTIDNADLVPSKPKTQTGNQLIREWNGKTHTVMVIENSFEWSGEHYTSLSAVAHAITGVRWSGPRFFGLNGGVLS